MYIYGRALKEVEKKINIIRYDYEYFNKYDSIDHIMTRIKSPESILNKLKKDNLEPTYKNLINNINDIAGIRVICPLKSDIFTIRKYISIPRIIPKTIYILISPLVYFIITNIIIKPETIQNKISCIYVMKSHVFKTLR